MYSYKLVWSVNDLYICILINLYEVLITCIYVLLQTCMEC